MGIKTSGFDSFDKRLTEKYSTRSIQEAEKRALKAGGNMMRNKVASSLNQVRDTGKLAMGTDLRDPKLFGGEMVAYLYWRGEHRTLAHLVNNGYHDRSGKFVKPRGYERVDTMIKINADLYYSLLKRELNKK
ncbi:MAG TPA: HK97 gp10 family phage protein [Staphylococcus saprophyticus]|nr:HK97 gp10 family phage protein [Staphylococcus saprophyticus]